MEIEGCEIYFPDTLFFNTESQDKYYLIRTDKEGKLTKTNKPSKLLLGQTFNKPYESKKIIIP